MSSSFLRNHPAFSLAAALVLIAGLGCGGRMERPGEGEQGGRSSAQTLTIKGSDTMVILAQRWAERFRAEHADTTIQVSGGGSGTGIAALLNGTCDIANSSRPIKDREREQVRTTRHSEVQEFKVALDTLAVYLHTGNPIRSLTMAQLNEIFSGRITNWNQLGGADAPIIVYSRENNSGTYAYFKEHVLDGGDFAATAQTLPGTAAVINAISRDPNGIGYGGIAYSAGVRAIAVAPEGGTPIEPTMQNATNGAYPLARFLYLYTPGEPSPLARRYIDFVLSPAGQGVVEGVGFYPLPRAGAAAATPAAAAPSTGAH